MPSPSTIRVTTPTSKCLLAAVTVGLHESMTVEDHAARVGAFFAEAKHPTLGRPYPECGYAPMVELLRYLEANGFTCYIVSGGGRDFMRPDHLGDLRHPTRARRRQLAGPEVRGRRRSRRPADPAGAGHLRRRPREAGADLEPHRPASDPVGRQLQRRQRDAEYSGRPGAAALRLLVLHDDAEREFDYIAGAETRAGARRSTYGWTVVSMQERLGDRLQWLTISVSRFRAQTAVARLRCALSRGGTRTRRRRRRVLDSAPAR